MVVRRLLLLVVLTAIVAAAGAGSAHACSCADLDPRDRVEAGDPALIGRVVEAPSGDPTQRAGDSRYVVRVERALNARLGDRVTVRADPYSSSFGVPREVGQRVGAFLHRTRGGWKTFLCSLVTPSELERATRPYPRPRGRGRVALLAGGSFGDARLMALDRRGRILGYGFGEGSVRRISVCPGGRVAAELVDRGRRRAFVAVRSLESLQVVSRTEVPPSTDELACADPAGATVYAGGLGYSGRPLVGRAKVQRVTGSSRTMLLSRPAEQFALTADSAYLWSGRRVVAISLADGTERTLLRMGLPERIVPSPFGDQVAVHAYDGRLRLVDPASGVVASRRLGPTWALAWLAPDRLLARVSGTAVILDRELRRQRRYGFFRAVGQAHVGGALFGTDRYRLVRLDLDSGRRRTAARLPDRGIADLVGVPDGPELDVPRRSPRTHVADAAAAWTRPPCAR